MRLTNEAIKSGNNTSTNVNTHNNGINTGEVHCTGSRQRLQHSNCCRGALHDNSQNQTSQDAQDGSIGEACQHFHKCRRVCKAINRTSHIHKANKQDTETHGDITNRLGLLGLDEHDKDNTQEQCNGGQGVSIKQPQEEVCAAFHECQVCNPCSNGSTNVGTHNDGNSLLQCQNACANQSYCQNNGSGRALNNCSD